MLLFCHLFGGQRANEGSGLWTADVVSSLTRETNWRGPQSVFRWSWPGVDILRHFFLSLSIPVLPFGVWGKMDEMILLQVTLPWYFLFPSVKVKSLRLRASFFIVFPVSPRSSFWCVSLGFSVVYWFSYSAIFHSTYMSKPLVYFSFSIDMPAVLVWSPFIVSNFVSYSFKQLHYISSTTRKKLTR